MSNINNLFPGQRIGTQTVDNVQYLGRTDGGNAPAGVVGEFVSSTVASGSAVSLTSGTTANVTSIALTPGDWDVWGIVALHPAASTVLGNVSSGTSITSATLDALGTYETDTYQVTMTVDVAKSTARRRLSVSAATTVYMVVDATFTTSTCTAYGVLNARRVR
jgi:hypothetical protein